MKVYSDIGLALLTFALFLVAISILCCINVKVIVISLFLHDFVENIRVIPNLIEII